MSRRRKAQDQSGADGKDPISPQIQTKKAKVDIVGTVPTARSTTSPLRAVSWEYEADKSKWVKYSDDQIKCINSAFKDGMSEVSVNSGKTDLAIMFSRMVQHNPKTGWEKRVRCIYADLSSDPNEYTWEWQDGKSTWKEYSKPTVYLLEAASMFGLDTVKVMENKKEFTVDLIKKVQTIKTGRGSKNVRRIKATAIATVKMEDMTKKVKKEKVETPRKENGEVKSLVFSGKAPVDSLCSIKDKTHIFVEGEDIWDAMLNQTNVMNNNNKFYLIQLLEDNMAKKFYVWQRWGRVGFNGQNNLVTCGADLEEAKRVFKKKFTDKTKNDWEDRDSFVKVPGKYDLLIMDYNVDDDDEKDAVDAPVKEEKKPPLESKLDKRIQNLIELICNIQAMEEMLKEMKYDTKKAPLGKLTTDQIKAGYEALKKIDSCIRSGDMGSKLVKACDEFYTRIPHCFGMKRPPLIRTTEEVKIKLDLLEALGDIQIAIKALQEEEESLEHPIDKHYRTLHCGLTPLDRDHDDFKMVAKYLENTHAATHNQYRMELLEVFAVDHENKVFTDVGNRMLLWHGSRLTNWVGILSQGLRIAPPEAPVTGYMFGKGIYFADMSSKSANYCFATRSKDVGLLLLSEVSLGKSNELFAADYTADKLPSDCRSVKGVGKVAPDPNETLTMADGVVVPLGKSMETGLVNPRGYTLNYNEYIVYQPSQVRMRYLIKVKFNFK